MRSSSFEAIVRALADAQVRYVVAGGIAVNAHGFLRQTKDADLVVQLTPENSKALFAALATLGYRPIVPITSAQFGDAELRETMIREKNMKVLQFFSDAHRETPVDVFVFEPFPFDAEFARAMVKPLTDSLEVRFVSLNTLIEMKEAVGRTQDRVDVENLRLLIPGDEKTS
jgi:hypothetical protein